MAEPVGGLFVRVGADFSSFVGAFEKADTKVKKFSRQFNKHAESVAKVTAAIAAAGVAIIALTKRVTDVGDKFAKMSIKVGASTEFLSAFAHAADLGGASVQQMEKGIGRMTRTMSDAANGLATAQRSFNQLGVEVKDADGSLREVPDVILEVADRFKGMTDQTKAAALAQEIFGRSGLGLLPTLKLGSAAIREQMEEAKRLGIVWSTDAAKAAEEYNDNLKRVQRAAEGLSRTLVGPLVEGLNKAALAMLEAQKNGESFFRTMIEGFRTLVTGDDAHKWNVQMAEAGEALLKAQNEMDQGMRVARAPGMQEWGDRLVRIAREKVDAARAEIKRLQDIKPILAPDAPGAKPKEDGKKSPPVVDEKMAADIAKREQEVRDVLHRVQEENDKRELEQVAFKIEERQRIEAEAAQARLDAADWEQEQAIKRGEEEIAIARQIAEQKKAELQRELAARQTFFNNLAGLMNTSSKKAFEFGKKVSIAQAAVKGAQAVMDAWQAGMSTGGPWAPFVAAAYAAAAGVNAANIIGNIRSQQFGGGGGAPVAPSQGASGVSPVGAGGAGPQGARGPDTIIKITGDTFSQRQVRELVERINEGQRDGGRLVLA
jgi:hypothetical protein